MKGDREQLIRETDKCKMNMVTHTMDQIAEDPERKDEFIQVKDEGILRLTRVPSLVTEEVMTNLEKMDIWLRSRGEKNEEGHITSVSPNVLFQEKEGLIILGRILWQLGFKLGEEKENLSIMQVMGCTMILEEMPRYHVVAKILNGMINDPNYSGRGWLVFLGKWFGNEMPTINLDNRTTAGYMFEDFSRLDEELKPKWDSFTINIPEGTIDVIDPPTGLKDWIKTIHVFGTGEETTEWGFIAKSERVELRRSNKKLESFITNSSHNECMVGQVILGCIVNSSKLVGKPPSVTQRRKSRKSKIPLVSEYVF